METSINLKSTTMTRAVTTILMVIIFILLLIIFLYKLVDNAEKIGYEYITSYTQSAETIVNKHALVLESGAASLSFFMTKNHSEEDIQQWMNNYIKYIKKTLGTEGIDVFGIINGKLVSGQNRLGSVTMPVSQMKWYHNARNNKGKIVFTDVYTDIVNGEKVFTLATVLENGRDVLALDIFPKSIGNKWLLDNTLPNHASYFLADTNGEIILMQSSINQPLENFQSAIKRTVGKIYSGNNEYNSAFYYIIDLEGKKRSVFYSFTQNNMIVILTISQFVLYQQSLNMIKNDVVLFFSKHIEFLIGSLFILFIIILRFRTLRKMVVYQNQSIKTLSNSYAALYRINLKTQSYTNIKQAEFAYIPLKQKGEYKDLLNSLNIVMDKETKVEFNKQFSIENMIKLSKTLVNEFGGDFKWVVNGENCWMNVSVLFDTYNIANDAIMCFRNVNTEKIKQLESMQLLEDNVQNMQDNIQSDRLFYSNISHDMRTPINGIMGFVELLKYNIDNKDKITEYADKIQITAQLLKELVDDILVEAKEKKGIKDDNEVVFNIKDDVENLVEIFKVQAKTENKNFDVLFNIKDNKIKGDYHKLCHILNNLLSNAFKYTRENDSILLTINQIENTSSFYYNFVVKDTGIGMSKVFLDKLFEPFAREKMFSDKKMQGTGLGMAIVLQRVRSMGGDISVDSSLGVGTTVTVSLPFEKYIESDKYDLLENNAENNFDEEYIKDKTILVVEDNKVNMEILNELLKIKNINVINAWNGKEAVEIIKNSNEFEIDAVLMDIIMPEMDGYTAAKEIRKLERKDVSSLPIIALTANAFVEDIEKTKEAGMKDCVTKPVNFKLLFKTLCKCIKSKNKE